MSSFDEDIGGLAKSVSRLARLAVAEYTPIVNSLVRGRSVDVERIERILDGLLDFGFDPGASRLFEQLCGHYRGIDPAAAEGYIAAHREMWGPDAGTPR